MRGVYEALVAQTPADGAMQAARLGGSAQHGRVALLEAGCTRSAVCGREHQAHEGGTGARGEGRRFVFSRLPATAPFSTKALFNTQYISVHQELPQRA